jgi:predicted TIM-barrel fold metal-dependent hydrolase
MKVIDIHVHCTSQADPEMDEYVRSMDEFGVAAALVHAVGDEYADRVGSNMNVLRAVHKHPGRLFGSMYIDLREPLEKNIRTVERFAAEGFKCVKMFPNLGFDPNDEVHEPVWQAAEAHGLACLSHCGWLAPSPRRPRTQSITSSPFHFEVPARRHPGVNFIMGHFGGGATYLETIVLTSRLSNVFGDVTPGWGKWVFENRMPGLQSLNFRQVLYGTDNMGAGYGADIQWWAATLRDMGRSDQDIEDFFYNNAARILGLTRQPCTTGPSAGAEG